MENPNKLLYCVLNWGLGHATRSVPIIRELIINGWEVHIASDGIALDFLKNEFPQLPSVDLQSYNINYRGNSIFWIIFRQIPKMIKARSREKKTVRQYVDAHQIKVIISDNRFGCYDDRTRNIFITHQWNLLSKKLRAHPLATRINQRMITQNFDEVWIPDDPQLQLSGILSKDNPDQKYLGVLSRFSPDENTVPDIDILIILSGPEPSRTRLEEKCVALAKSFRDKNIHLVRGSREESEMEYPEHVQTYDLLGSTELEKLIHRSKSIVSRSGYTSLMDYVHLGINNLLLIPTKYQTEQEYLAKYFAEKQDGVFHTTEEMLNVADFQKILTYQKNISKKDKKNYLQELISQLEVYK